LLVVVNSSLLAVPPSVVVFAAVSVVVPDNFAHDQRMSKSGTATDWTHRRNMGCGTRRTACPLAAYYAQ
jgi:hypothetical protein